MDPQHLYDPDLAERTAQLFCRKFRFGHDGEDFRQEVHLKLQENNCGRLGTYKHGCSLSSFYYTVIRNLAIDYQRAHGMPRWRPSAWARRTGPAAVELETLMYRDGLPRVEAIQTVLSHGHHKLSERELQTLADSIPPRMAPAIRSDSDVETLPDETRDPGDDLDHDQRLVEVRTKLEQAIGRLEPKARLAIQMFCDGFPVTRIARFVPMGKRPNDVFGRILRRLRRDLEADGLTAADLRDLLLKP